MRIYVVWLGEYICHMIALMPDISFLAINISSTMYTTQIPVTFLGDIL